MSHGRLLYTDDLRLPVGLAEGEVDTYGETITTVQRYALLGEFAQHVIHADKDVEAPGMNVGNPTETGSQSAETYVDTSLEPLDGRDNGADTFLIPTVLALHTCGTKQAHAEFLVERHLVFHTYV